MFAVSCRLEYDRSFRFIFEPEHEQLTTNELMHIETLKVFCDLVDLQSFSLAAERNFITQSAVSQQIRTLEDKFKRRLLERVRGRREVRLTPAGEVFYREAKNVLD